MEVKRNIVIVSHKYLTQPDDDLVLYLNKKKCSNVLHIKHSFYHASDRKSYFTWYKNGKVNKDVETRDYRHFPEPIIYLKEMFYTIYCVVISKERWQSYVGMDGLLVLFGNILRAFGFVEKTIFWAIDFVPKDRFESAWKNRVYRFVNMCGYKKADEMWDLSPRMFEARQKYLGINKEDYRFHRVVPYGVWTDRIKRYTYNECEKNTLVFMGVLIPKQGVQLIIEAIPKIIKKIPDFKFKIIGGGEYGEKLKILAEKLDVSKYCKFMGKIDLEDYESRLLPEIAKSALSIAPYVRELDTWTYYADPGKVKTYLSCGVPVLLTDLTWNAKEIQRRRCGAIISEDSDSVVEGVLRLFKENVNKEYRKNALEYAKTFNCEKIFGEIKL